MQTRFYQIPTPVLYEHLCNTENYWDSVNGPIVELQSIMLFSYTAELFTIKYGVYTFRTKEGAINTWELQENFYYFRFD